MKPIGLAAMTTRELMEYCDRLASGVPPAPKRVGKLEPLTDFEQKVFDTASRSRKQRGYIDRNELMRTHSIVDRKAVINLINKFKLRGLSAASARYRPPKKPSSRSPEEASKLAAEHEGFLKWSVNYFAGLNPALPIEDLMQAGRLGMQRAAEIYDPERGYPFISLARYWIRRNLIREAKTRTHSLSLQDPVRTDGNDERKLEDFIPGKADYDRRKELEGFVSEMHELHKTRRLTEQELLVLILKHGHELNYTQIGALLEPPVLRQRVTAVIVRAQKKISKVRYSEARVE